MQYQNRLPIIGASILVILVGGYIINLYFGLEALLTSLSVILFFAACPLLMFFMMRGMHSGSNGENQNNSNSTEHHH